MGESTDWRWRKEKGTARSTSVGKTDDNVGLSPGARGGKIIQGLGRTGPCAFARTTRGSYSAVSVVAVPVAPVGASPG